MLYLCITNNFDLENMYRYGIYFVSIIVLYLLNSKKCDNYIIDLVILVEYMQLFMQTEEVFITILLTVFISLFKMILEKTKPVDKSNILMEETENDKIELPIAFYMAISNFLVILLQTGMLLI